MHFSANQSIAQQHIDQLHHEAAQRRLARSGQRRGRAQSGRNALRQVIGYRLVVLGWRLLDTSPRLAERPAR
jgi:hypothetical protein